MALIIERHSSDIQKFTKIKVIIDNKTKYQLKPGEKIEIEIAEGKHKIDCRLNLIKGSKEIYYPKDKHIIISYRVSPVGIDMQSVLSENNNMIVTAPPIFSCSSAINCNVGELTVTDKSLVFREIGKDAIAFNYLDIRAANRSFGNLTVCMYTGLSYTFALPKEQSEQILTFVINKVKESFEELHKGYTLSFGGEARIFINEEKETFYIQEGEWISPIYMLEQIISYGIDEVSAKQNFIGDAALGSLIDGQRGAFFGVLHAAQNGNKVEAIRMNLTIKTENDMVVYCLKFADSVFAMEKGSKKYDESMRQCLRFIAFMDDYRKQKNATKSNETDALKITNMDITEELRKYKALLDDGIIDEEEFKAKKKQLLNI